MVAAVTIMRSGTLLFQPLPRQLLWLFGAAGEVLSMGITALRISSSGFLPAGISRILSASFQALGNGLYNLMLSAVGQLILLLPRAWVLAAFFGVYPVWGVSYRRRRISQKKIKPLSSTQNTGFT